MSQTNPFTANIHGKGYNEDPTSEGLEIIVPNGENPEPGRRIKLQKRGNQLQFAGYQRTWVKLTGYNGSMFTFTEQKWDSEKMEFANQDQADALTGVIISLPLNGSTTDGAVGDIVEIDEDDYIIDTDRKKIYFYEPSGSSLIRCLLYPDQLPYPWPPDYDQQVLPFDFDEYFTCRTWDGTNLGQITLKVAKQLNMRRSFYDNKEADPGWVLHYVAPSARRAERIDGTADPLMQFPDPAYTFATDIWIQRSRGGTGVQVDSKELMLLEISPPKGWIYPCG